MNTNDPLQAEDRGSLYAPPTAAVEDIGDGFLAGQHVVYAGFWRRTAALCIDSLLVGIVFYAIFLGGLLAMGGSSLAGLESGDTPAGLFVAAYLIYPVISALYYIGMESSATQATLGKMAVGIKVTDTEGHRMSRGRAFGRWVSHLICYVTLYIGYIMAGFTERKRGLHDMVTSTLVVDRWAYTPDPGRQQKGLGIVTIIVLGLIALIYFAIILAIAIPAYQAYVERAAMG